MNYKKLTLFLLTVFILLSTTSLISASDSHNSTVNETIELDDTTIADDNDVNVASEDTSEDISTVDEKTVKTEETGITETTTTPKTHIVNSTTVSEIFDFSTNNGNLSDIVSEGDVLDFQGTINLTNQSLTFNKAVNVTSTTGDSLICLNTVAGSYFGEDPGSSFVFDEDGSYSNVSNINLYNTQLWVNGATQIVFDNISVVVNGSCIGSGVGVSAIRGGSTYITLKNSYFYTKDNGGSTTIALSSANYCTIDNCTVQAEGNVGNLIYLNFYNIDSSYQADWNRYNNITNNHLIGPETVLGICYGIALTGSENLIAGNVIDYGGSAITTVYGMTAGDNMFINNTVTNTSSTVSLPDNVTFTGNSVAGKVSIAANSVIENNTIANITSIGGNTTLIGNNITILTATTTSVAYANSSIINNTIMGNVTLSNNYTITGNNITGSVTLNQNSSTLNNNVIMGTLTVSSNNTIINGNNITGTITISSNAANTLLRNNTVNGIILINGDNITVTSNNITSDSSYTIEVTGNNALINDNYLIATTLAGDDSVVISSGSGSVVENNTPINSDSVVITNDNYSDYFYKNGTFMGNVANYTTIILSGYFSNKNFTFTEGIYTLIGDENFLKTSVINVTSTAKLTIMNIVIDNQDCEYTQAIIIETDGNIVTSNKISAVTPFTAITITSNNNTVTDNYIIIYTEGGVWINTPDTTYGIGIQGSNNNVSSNNITITDHYEDQYSRVDGIIIQSRGNNTADNNTVYNNTIKVNSTGYAYSISIESLASNNNISNNTLYANATQTAYGIRLFSASAVNTTIYDNKINITSSNVAYGVVIYSSRGGNLTVNVSFNQISATADQVYLMEVYNYAHDITIANNILRGNGNYTMGIGIANSHDILITDNTISINGTTNGTTTSNNIISPTTAGIYIYNTTNVKINSTTPSTTSTTQKINVTNGVGVHIIKSSNVTLYKVGVIANYSSNIQDALVIENSSNITVYNGSICTTGYTITAQNSANITIFNMTGNTITTNGINLTSQKSDYAIKLNNVKNVEVYNSKIYAATYNGNSAVEVIDCTNVEIYNIPYESFIELDTTALALNQAGTIYINILTDIGETRANGTATVTIDDTTYSVTITNGVGSFTYTPTTTDPIDITVDFESNDVRIADYATLTTQIQLENYVNLIIDKINTSSGSNITLTVNIIVNGIATSEGYITIKVDGVTLTDDSGKIIMVNVTNGLATYDYTLPVVSKDTTYNISIMYTGSVILESDNITITVLAQQNATIMIETSGDLKPGSTVTFTATITDNEGNAVTSGRAVFKLNGKTLRDSEGNVIYAYVSNGIASIEYNIPDNYVTKDYVLTVVFAGSGFTRSEANTTITITKNNTKVTTSDITVTKGENTKLTATITDDEGNPVTGTIKVVIKINNKTVMQNKVVDGVIDFTLFTDSFTNPTYTVTIIVGENNYYNRYETSLTLTVKEE